VELEIDNEYIMSPKDLNTIGFLDRILKAGVTVLKIEGRGRGPEYVKTVTQCYREALDSIAAGTYSPEKVSQWNERLKTVYNRGFWDGYYLGRRLGEWSGQYGSQSTRRKVYLGKVTNYFKKIRVAEVKMETGSLSVGDTVLIIGPTTGVVEETIREIRFDLQPVKEVKKGDLCSIPVETFLRRSDQVYRVDVG
jgi:putative protease